MTALPNRPLLVRASLAALFLLLALLPAAGAQDDQMHLQSTADYVYGQTMNFNLLAINVGEIEGVTLFFRLGTSADSYSVDVPVRHGPRIEISYALDLTQIRLQPFGTITYWWQLEREFGSPLRVPEQVISYVDDQFAWQQLVTIDEQGGGSVRIHWTGESGAIGEKARDIVFEMLPQIGRLVPLDQVLPFDVYIYPSTGDIGAALRLAGRDYRPGQTLPDLGIVLATVVNDETADKELRSELSRGLVDLLLYQALGQFSYNLPHWVNRGLAGVVRGDRDALLEDALLSAVATDTTLTVADLCAGLPIEDDLAIAQSESLVAYIIEVYGEAAFRDLVMSFAEGVSCEQAMPATLNMTPDQLNSAWLRAQSSNQGSRAVAEIAVWLVLVLAGFGLAGLLLLWPRRRPAR